MIHHRCRKTSFTLLFQYFVRPPLFFLTTAAILRDMLSIRLEQYSGKFFWVHTIFIAVFNDSILVGCWSADHHYSWSTYSMWWRMMISIFMRCWSSFFITCYKFSIGFRSGLYPGSPGYQHFSLVGSSLLTLPYDMECRRAWTHCNHAQPRGSLTYLWVDHGILRHLWWYLAGENTDLQYYGQTLLPRHDAWRVFHGLYGVIVFISGANWSLH